MHSDHCAQSTAHALDMTCTHLLLDSEDIIEAESAICFSHGLDGPLAQVLQIRERDTLVHRHQAHHQGFLHRHFEQQPAYAVGGFIHRRLR